MFPFITVSKEKIEKMEVLSGSSETQPESSISGGSHASSSQLSSDSSLPKSQPNSDNQKNTEGNSRPIYLHVI